MQALRHGTSFQPGERAHAAQGGVVGGVGSKGVKEERELGRDRYIQKTDCV